MHWGSVERFSSRVYEERPNMPYGTAGQSADLRILAHFGSFSTRDLRSLTA